VTVNPGRQQLRLTHSNLGFSKLGTLLAYGTVKLRNRCDDSMRAKAQHGWTLLEIVLLVLIVGLILAGVVKGQEMITSAKVKRVAGQLDEIRASYLGFMDRYKALPGDYADADVTLDCGATCLRGNGDGRIHSAATPLDGSQVREDLLVWTHLGASGFLKGDYAMADGEALATDANSPTNAYSAYMQIAFDGAYGASGSGTPRHNLKTGPQVPIEVAAELDRKTDDGKPYQGTLQFSAYSANGAPSPAEGGADACTTALDMEADWNLRSGSANCGAAKLL
jgi:type II secretory pathway pseudopilin PulG